MNDANDKTGGPAFPSDIFVPCPPDMETGEMQPPNTRTAPGMSLRDWFAGMAMQAIVSHQQHGNAEMTAQEELVGCAYEIADAMLKERAK